MDTEDAQEKSGRTINTEVDESNPDAITNSGNFTENTAVHAQGSGIGYYVPVELRTWYLVMFSIFTLAIFILLQMAAASPALRNASSDLRRRQNGPTAPPGSAFSGFDDWGAGYYFLAQYLPTTISVLYGLLWKCTWFRLKELEPIWQLAKPMGQYGGWSLYLKYGDAPYIAAAWTAFGGLHWCVLLGALNVALTTICTAFAPEVLHIRTEGTCGPTADGDGCTPYLAIRAPLAWALGVVLAAAFVTAVILVFTQRRRKSKIYAEATSIAGVATLITDPEHPRILAQSPVDPYVFERYMLETVTKIDGSKAYGIIGETRPESTAAYAFQPAVPRKYKTPLLLKLPSLGVLWFAQIGSLVLIVIYRYVSKVEAGNGFESFMYSDSFGVKLLFTIVGLAIRSYWSRLDAHNRALAPYRALCSQSGASPGDSVCLTTQTHAIIALFSSRSFRHPIDGAISLVAVLGEILVVTLSSVPYSTSISYAAFNASVLISTVILGMMTIALPLLGLRTWRENTALPPPQTCLADVIRLLTDKDAQKVFLDLSKEDRRTRDKEVESRASRWRLEKNNNGAWTLKICECY